MVISLLLVVLAACSQAQKVPEPPPQVAAAPPPVATPPKAAPASTPAPVAEVPPAAATPTLPESLYFLYDSSTISSADTEPLSQLGRFLANHPATKLRIEGNCDEENHSWTYEYRILNPHQVGSLVLHFAPEGTLTDYTLNTPFEDETKPLDSALAQ